MNMCLLWDMYAIAVGVTLVVCPISLLAQWKDEIQKFSNLKVLLYYGENRAKLNKHQIESYHVIVTR